ncbi:MAG: hypothetical protein M1164_00680 [Candidatus Marsarchaeota archaeon]|nr:hypothetical protein [Candidatus Marsarchaeota archaeon]
MGLFNRLKTDKLKEIDEFISEPSEGLFKCNICGMLSKDQLAMRKHVIGFHKEYVVYKHKYKKISEMATATWINIYYRILYILPFNWSDKQIEVAVSANKSFIMNIIGSIQRVTINGKTIGCINPILGVNPLFNSTTFSGKKAYSLLDPINSNAFLVSKEVFESLEKGNVSQYTFHRVFTIRSTILNGNQKIIKFLIRFREGGRNGQWIGDKKKYTSKISSTERLTYGYSPLDFIPDINMFIELDKTLTKSFNIQGDFRAPTVAIFFNEKKEPYIQTRIGMNLYVEHRVVDRIKLAKEAPEIEKKCFGDKGLDDFIEFEKNYVKKNKGKDTETIKEWLGKVDNLMKGI